jgi:hypothetical protein
VSEQTENPPQPDDSSGDVPAALEPDAPSSTDWVPESPAGDESSAPTEPAMADPEAAVPAWTPPTPPPDLGPAVADRPEIAIGAAFAGGLVFALILKRFAR